MTYWYPKRVLRGGFPAWAWLIPILWPMLLLYYAIWLVVLAFWLIVSIPVNLIRLVTHHSTEPAARYDAYTGKRLS